MPTSEVRTDDNDQFSWDMIITTFADSGALDRRFITYDDGTRRDEDYDEGTLRKLTLSDPGTSEAPEGAKSWERIEIDYDENGVITDRYQLNDNGIQTLTNYEAGVISLKIEFDNAPNGREEDAAPWEIRWTYYDEQGQVELKTETRDDGVEIRTEFEAGVRRYQLLDDQSEGGTARAYETIEIYYDETGQQEARFEKRDDGVEILTQYENGIRRQVEEIDLNAEGGPSDARIWERRDAYYDENGVIEARFEKRDDGVEILTQYENGVLRQVEQVDLNELGGASDARIWERLDTYYDENGQIEARFELRDNGVEILTQYENGVRRSIEQVDLNEVGGPSDAEVWERRDTYYDENGQIEAKFELRDDGVETLTQYENGVRRSMEQRDAPGSDARSWEQIDTYYDENGDAAFRFELRDNGVTVETEYENGKRSLVTLTDGDRDGAPHDTEEWDIIRMFYAEDGQLGARETIYDNNDVVAYLFEDGNRVARFDVDGDGSETWETREIYYNADGTIGEVNYDVDFFATPSF